MTIGGREPLKRRRNLLAREDFTVSKMQLITHHNEGKKRGGEHKEIT